MDGELAGGDAVTVGRLAHQLTGQRAVLLGRDHPGEHQPAEQIEHHIEREITSPALGGKLGDIPCPDLVGRGGAQPRNGVMLGGTLGARAALAQQPIHGAHRAQILAALEQALIDLARRLIAPALAVQDRQYTLALGIAHGPRLLAMLALGTRLARAPPCVDGAAIEPERGTGHCQRQPRRALVENGSQASFVLLVRSSIDKAFFAAPSSRWRSRACGSVARSPSPSGRSRAARRSSSPPGRGRSCQVRPHRLRQLPAPLRKLAAVELLSA